MKPCPDKTLEIHSLALSPQSSSIKEEEAIAWAFTGIKVRRVANYEIVVLRAKHLKIGKLKIGKLKIGKLLTLPGSGEVKIG